MIEVLHPISQKPMVGWPLGKGAKMQETDLYDSTDGSWRNFPFSGIRPAVLNTIVIRTEAPSTEAQQLLVKLNQDDGENYSCLGLHGQNYYLFSNILQVQDINLSLESISPRVVSELIDYGYVCLISDIKPYVYGISAYGGNIATQMVEVSNQQ